jgi:hypothetical protein
LHQLFEGLIEEKTRGRFLTNKNSLCFRKVLLMRVEGKKKGGGRERKIRRESERVRESLGRRGGREWKRRETCLL